MRICLLVFLLYSISIAAQAPYGLEWIDASKPHYKFRINDEGIYRLTHAFLSANCPDILTASADDICIYNNGEQISIYVSWTSSPTSSDFIEFYGDALNGDVDQRLYDDTNTVLNPYTSLFKDTNYYYLTLRTGSNQRFNAYLNDTLSITSPYLTHCIGQSLKDFKINYIEGRRYYYSATGYVYGPAYERGEGWGTNSYASQSIPTPNALNIGSENARLRLRLFGKNEATHNVEFKLNSITIGTKQEVGSTVIDYNNEFASSAISAGNSTLTITPLQANNHGYALGFVSLSYPRDFNFSGLKFFKFSLPESANSARFQFTNYNSTDEVVLYDFVNKIRTTHAPSTSHRFLVNLQSKSSLLAIVDKTEIKSVLSISKLNFSALNTLEGDFVIIANRNIQKDSSGLDVIQEYKLYKESSEGGSFKVVIAYMDELQEWFGYGIPKHPIAIRKYLQWAFNRWSTKPKYALLIGKGYTANSLHAATPSIFSSNLIPSYGHAPSDYHYATMDASNIQFVPIGRISARNGNTVRHYLNKLKEYDAEYNATAAADQNPTKKEYMKWLIHLGGGSGVSQQTDYRNNLKFFEDKIKDTLHGAKVFSVFKNGPDISEDVTSVDLTTRINTGVSLITFFGHSSASIFDVGIGEPSTFTNKGKYPIFLANGCNSGYVFSSAFSYSENFINLPDKGAIGFLATTNNAFDVSLFQFGNTFYNHLAKLDYNSSIGDLALKTSQSLLSGPLNYLKISPMEFNLNGDPSVRMTQYAQPDYYIDKNSVIFPNYNLNSTIDSFPIKIIVQNLGKAIKKDIKIKIERINNGTTVIYENSFNAPYFMDTFEMMIPISDQNFGLGINNFNVKIDAGDEVAEISEQNNEIKNIGNVLVENDDIIPIFPFEYAIVSKNTTKLTAMSTLIDKKVQNYHFEIDTTELYNSPLLKRYTALNTAEGVVSWLPQLVFQDSVVYYWRVAKDSVSGKGFRWNESSFVYIPNQPSGGWNQSHYYQFQNNDYKNVVLNTNREFRFVNDVKSISVRTNGSNNTYETEWYLNNARQAVMRETWRMSNGIFVIWIDGNSGIAHQSLDSNYGSATWGEYGSIQFGYTGIPREGFVFQDTGLTPANHPRPNTSWSTILLDFINQVPSGDYLIFYSNKQPVYDQWDDGLKNYFTNAGFSDLSKLVNKTVEAPFIFGYRKDNSSFPVFSKLGADYSSFTSGEMFISGSWKEGYKESVSIGPTLKWHTLSYQLENLESPSSDNNSVELYGIKSDKKKTLLATYTANKVDTPLTWIDPNTYVNLQLKLNTEDDITRTPVQLKYWRVYFDDIGEVAVNNSPNQVPQLKDTIQNGEPFVLKFGSETLNEKPFDSLSYKISVVQGGQSKLLQGKLSPLKGDTFILNERQILMENYFEGENQVIYEINPASFGYQKEKYAINNYGRTKFYVKSDLENPLLDVTFDGVHIINNELVSSSPNIKIVLKDENEFLLLNDTSLINLFIKYPDGSLKPVYFNQPNLNYTLATNSKDNRAEINFKPILTDGTYQLIVKDTDKSGNSSSRNGSFDYKISFQVITKNQVSRFLNYPNPFSTSTQFVFTITGAQVPDFIKIQIITIRGHVVKEIFKEDLGPIKLGINRTEYAWDGRDQYGDLLANGVYLYKVTVKNAGEDYPMMDEKDFQSITRSTKSLNKYFKDGWGKMVIIR